MQRIGEQWADVAATPVFTQIDHIRYRGIDPYDKFALTQLELPSSLQSLVLSRLDQLGERHRRVQSECA